MIQIAISAEAFEAITATFAALPKGSVGFELEPQSGPGSRRLIRLHEIWLDKVRAMRRKRESYSDVILRLARGMDADENTPIVANAARLLRDAKLLNEHGRHASAFALATLSLEEIGRNPSAMARARAQGQEIRSPNQAASGGLIAPGAIRGQGVRARGRCWVRRRRRAVCRARRKGYVRERPRPLQGLRRDGRCR